MANQVEIFADTDELAGRLAGTLAINKEQVKKEVPEWPQDAPTLLALNSLSHPLFFHVLRLFLANADKPHRLAFVRVAWPDAELEQLTRAIHAEYARAAIANEQERTAVGALPAGRWRDDRLECLASWKTIPTLDYATFSLESKGVEEEIKNFFGGALSQMPQVAEPEHESRKKPPNLHWTPSALDGDIEIALRFHFSLSSPPSSLLSRVASSAAPFCSTVYEWTRGVLICNEHARVHVQKLAADEIEVAGRVCYEEMDSPSSACRAVWRLLSLAVREVDAVLSSSPHLPWQVQLLLLGPPLFTPSIQARSFPSATAFMNAAARCGKVAFSLQDSMVQVNLDVLFPDGIPSSLSALCEWSSLLDRLTPSSSLPDASSSASSSAASSACLAAPASRGRRVSFGAVRTVGASPNGDEFGGGETFLLQQPPPEQAIHF